MEEMKRRMMKNSNGKKRDGSLKTRKSRMAREMEAVRGGRKSRDFIS